MKSDKVEGNGDGDGKKARKSSRGKDGSVRWFNPAPTSVDEDWLDANTDRFIELLLKLLEDIPENGRYTVKYDVRSGRWIAILFVDGGGDDGGMVAMSVRGATATDAAYLLAYFHLVKFEDGWVNIITERAGRWG